MKNQIFQEHKQLTPTHLSRVLSHQQAQHGATFLGMLIMVAAIMLLGMVGLKVFPAYSEFYSVKTVMRSMNQESLSTMSPGDIKSAFDRRASIAYVSSVTGKDLDIQKNAGETVISVKYQVVKPILANVSVLLDFACASNDKP